MRVRDILHSKGTEVVTVDPGSTVHDAMRRLVEHDIGSLVVLEDAEVVGIITERDMLRLGARRPNSVRDVAVRDAMTVDLIVARPEDDLYHCMDVMTRNRVRHLPVLEGGDLKGIVSIGDVVNACRKDAEAENEHLKKYIRGGVR